AAAACARSAALRPVPAGDRTRCARRGAAAGRRHRSDVRQWRRRAAARRRGAGDGSSRRHEMTVHELERRTPRLKRVVVGRPMASDQMEETLLPKWLALPIFASDPLSSVAYATEAALVVLVGASAGAAHLAFPIALANLRGVKEAGILFAIPTYGFVASIFALVGVGVARCAHGTCPHAAAPHPLTSGVGAVTAFVVLRAFSSGSTALTGVEAIAN